MAILRTTSILRALISLESSRPKDIPKVTENEMRRLGLLIKIAPEYPGDSGYRRTYLAGEIFQTLLTNLEGELKLIETSGRCIEPSCLIRE